MTNLATSRAALLLVLLAACTGDLVTDINAPAHDPPSPIAEIVDAGRGGGNVHFQWHIPVAVDVPVPRGPFDPARHPVVEVCEWSPTGCAASLVTYTLGNRVAGGLLRVDVRKEMYKVWFFSDRFPLDVSTDYRILVRENGETLGYADMDVVANASEASQVDRSQFVPVILGVGFPIRFRLEQSDAPLPDPGPIRDLRFTGTTSSSLLFALTGAEHATSYDCRYTELPWVNWGDYWQSNVVVHGDPGEDIHGEVTGLESDTGYGLKCVAFRGTLNAGDAVFGPISSLITARTDAVVPSAPAAADDDFVTDKNTPVSRTPADPDDLLDNDDVGQPPAVLASFGGGDLGGDVSAHPAGTTVDPLPQGSGSITVEADGSFTFVPPTDFLGSYGFAYTLENEHGSSTADVAIVVSDAPLPDPGPVRDLRFTGTTSSSLQFALTGAEHATSYDCRYTELPWVNWGDYWQSNVVVHGDPGEDIHGEVTGLESDTGYGLKCVAFRGTLNAGDAVFGPISSLITARTDAVVPGAPAATDDAYFTKQNVFVARTPADADDLRDNDDLGEPPASVGSFGGGMLGGDVSDHPAGTTVSPLPQGGGSLTVGADGGFAFTPPTGFTGDYTFSYQLDNSEGSSSAAVTITVGKDPDAVDDEYTTATDVALDVPDGTGDLLDNDDPGVPSAVMISWGAIDGAGTVTDHAPGTTETVPGKGDLTVRANGSLTFVPVAAFNGIVTFQYRLTNEAGTDDATVTVEVKPGDTAPSVVAVAPEDGATGVGVEANVVITFSEPVTLAGDWVTMSCTSSGSYSVSGAGGATPLHVSGANPTFTVDPAEPLAEGETCTVTVDGARVTDDDAEDPPDAMDGTFDFAFSTDHAPAVTGMSPAAGAENVAVDADVTVTFGEPVTVTGDWFTIVCSESGRYTESGIGGTGVSVTGNGTSFTLDPDDDFEENESCTVTVLATQVSDADVGDPPDNLADDVVFAFSTDSRPMVVSTSPGDGDTGVPVNGSVGVTFSEAVTLEGDWFTIVCSESGTYTKSGAGPATGVTVTGDGTSFTLDPDDDFAEGETCTVTVLGVQVSDADAGDPPDNLADDVVFAFSTDVAPIVTTTTPANGDTGVPVNSNVDISFSEAVTLAGDWFTIVCSESGTYTKSGTGPATGVSVTGDGTSFTLDPDDDFSDNETCTVTILAAQVSDADAGDPPDNLPEDFSFDFMTEVAPAVTDHSPADGATNVALDADLVITFNEPVTVTNDWFTIVCSESGTYTKSGAGPATGVTVTGDGTSFTLDPDDDFAEGETCAVTVDRTLVADDDTDDPPDNMAEDFTFEFTTDEAPAVETTDPAAGATDVPVNADITITFTEPVDPVDDWFTISCTLSGEYTPSGAGGTPVAVDGSANPVFTLDPATPFSQSETCTVTVHAALVTDADAGDPPDAMAGDFAFAFSTPDAPAPTDDTYSATGNIAIDISVAEGVLDNDDPSFPVTEVQGDATKVGKATATESAGRGGVTGFVKLESDGSFSYDPPPGFQGTDTFTYGTASGTATVSIDVDGVAWFIDNSAAGSDNLGTFNDPFVSIEAFNDANNGDGLNPAAGDPIALRTGTGTYTEDDGANLQNGQRLIGGAVRFDSEFVADPNSRAAYLSFASGSDAGPTIVVTGQGNNGIDLAADNTIRGLTIGDTDTTPNVASYGMAGNDVDNLVVNAVSIIGFGGALDLRGGIFGAEVVFDEVSSTDAPQEAIRVRASSGTLRILSAASEIVNPQTGQAVRIGGGSLIMQYPGNVTQDQPRHVVEISNTSGGLIEFGGTVSQMDPGAKGVKLSGVDGDVTFVDLDLGTVTDRIGGEAGILIEPIFNPNGTVNNGEGTYTFDDVSIFTTGTAGVRVSHTAASGSLVIEDGTIDALGTPAIDAESIDLTLTGVNAISLNSGTEGIRLKDVTGSVRLTGTTDIDNPTGSGIDIETSVGGLALDLQGLDVAGAGSNGIRIAAAGGGTVCLNLAGSTSGGTPEGYVLDNGATSTFELQDFTGDGSLEADVMDWVTTTKGNNLGGVAVTIGSPFSASVGDCVP